MNGDQVRNWQIASVKKDIELFNAMLEGVTDQTQRRIINQEIERLYGVLRSLGGKPDLTKYDTQPLTPVQPDAA